MSEHTQHTEPDAPRVDEPRYHTIEIAVGPSPMSAEVFLDGKRWKGLQSIGFAVGPGQAVEVTAKFWADVNGRFVLEQLEGARLGRRTPDGAILAPQADNGAAPE